MSSVPVYLLSGNPEDVRTSMVKSFFRHPMFALNEVYIEPPTEYRHRLIGSHLSRKHFLEAHRLNWCLQQAKEKYPNDHVIVIKDSSVCHADAETVAEIISAAIDAGGWDVCYLCRWLDRCDLYSERKPILGRSTLIVKTQAPQGFQAIMFSPEGRDMVLGDKGIRTGGKFTPIRKPIGHQLSETIARGGLNATCIVPNLIQFDISAAKSPNDHMKLSECHPQAPLPVGGPDNDPPPPAVRMGAYGAPKTAAGAYGVPQTASAYAAQAKTTSGFNVPGWLWLLLLFGLLLLLIWYFSRQKPMVKVIPARVSPVYTPRGRNTIQAVPSAYMS